MKEGSITVRGGMVVNQSRQKAMSVQRTLSVNMDEKINQNKRSVRQATPGVP